MCIIYVVIYCILFASEHKSVLYIQALLGKKCFVFVVTIQNTGIKLYVI